MKTLDFLTIDWGNWETNAYRNAIKFVFGAKQKEIYPPFEFEVKTMAADK